MLRKFLSNMLFAAVFMLTLTWGLGPAAADSVDATINTGKSFTAVAVNPVTNKIYFANRMGNDVTVIDGATNSVAATVYTGDRSMPYAIAVNPDTNKIYVANFINNTISVIDGTNNSMIATIDVNEGPLALAVNTVTNKIYVANNIDNCVTVIDGANDSIVTTISTGPGTGPQAIAVNPASNKIYVANYLSSNVMTINGTNNSIISTVPVGSRPRALAVNPVTNKIYVASYFGNNVTVVNGASDSFEATVTVGNSPRDAIAVNPVTNRIYVANARSALTVINGSDNTTTTLSGGSGSNVVVLNATTNKIYVGDGSNVQVINGADHSWHNLALGSSPVVMGANPVTNKIYVASGVDVTVLNGAPDGPVENLPLNVSVTSLPGNVTYSATPTFDFTAQSSYSPHAPAIQNIYYQLDTCAGQWQSVTGFVSAGDIASGHGTAPQALAPGPHILYAFAVDSQAAISINTGYNSSPVIGEIEAYAFTYVIPAPPVVTGMNPSSGPEVGGTTVMVTGSGFTGATSVGFGDKAATSFTVNDDTTITTVSPAGTGAVGVTVTGPGGNSAPNAPSDLFTYVHQEEWGFVFEDYKKPDMKLYINTDNKTFMFAAPGKEFPVKHASKMSFITNAFKYDSRVRVWRINSSRVNIDPLLLSQMSMYTFKENPGGIILLPFHDKDINIMAVAIGGSFDSCFSIITDNKHKKYVLTDKPGLENI